MSYCLQVLSPSIGLQVLSPVIVSKYCLQLLSPSIVSKYCLVIDRTPNPFGKSRTEPNRRFGRTEPSAEIGPIYRTRSAVLAEHSSVGRTIVRQKNSSVRFGRNRVRSITSIVSSYCLQVLSLDFLRICFKYIFAIPFH